MKSLLVALGFLTRIPIPNRVQTDDKALANAMAYFPLVGLLLGVILILVNGLLAPFLPMEVLNLILVLLLLLLTGAMHLDGLADTIDGLSAKTKNKEETLQIMRDSRIGVMGVIAIIMTILFKYELLNGIPIQLKGGALILMCSLSRWSQVAVSYYSRYARDIDGLGRPFIGNVRKQTLYMATAFIILISVLISFPKGIFIFFLISLFSFGASRYIQGRIGGQTGDSVGAISEINEVLTLFVMMPWLNL